MSLVKFLIFILVAIKMCHCTTPVVLWHGIGEDHLDGIKQMIREKVNESVHIKSIRIGESAVEDFESGILVHPNDQIASVCAEISFDDNLKDGFHAIGFSQGAQFL